MTPTVSKATLRAAFGLLLVLAALPVANAYVARPVAPAPDGTAAATASENLSVVTIDGVGPGQLVAFNESGGVVYRNDSHWIYHDVDPSSAGSATVTYVASRHDVPDSACPTDDPCIHNVVERLNLTTDEVTRLYETVDRRFGSSQTHDVDRVNDSVLLVGDIGPPDRVYMVNTTTDEVIWEWRVSEAYDESSGGHYPDDWTHLNDVEYLPDGRVLVDLRNQDQVVFVDPGSGLQEEWTLGADDNHDVLYEQHNPDYIPPARGGPALLVADSENNRVVEYQRSGGEWVRTWTWRDSRLQWPRDADRLPNGNTLVVDSHGNRVLEVAPNGSVVWQRTFPDGTYDAERLRTGDESAGGWSMRSLRRGEANVGAGGAGTTTDGERSNLAGGQTVGDRVTLAVTSLVPAIVLHGFLFALPGWVDAVAATALLFQGLLAACWAGAEVVARRRRG